MDFKELAAFYLPKSMSSNEIIKLSDEHRASYAKMASNISNILIKTKTALFKNLTTEIAYYLRGVMPGNSEALNTDQFDPLMSGRTPNTPPRVDNTPISISQQTASTFALSLFPDHQYSIRVRSKDSKQKLVTEIEKENNRASDMKDTDDIRSTVDPANSDFFSVLGSLARDYFDFGNATIYIQHLPDKDSIGLEAAYVPFSNVWFSKKQSLAMFFEVTDTVDESISAITYTHIFPCLDSKINPAMRVFSEQLGVNKFDSVIELVFAKQGLSALQGQFSKDDLVAIYYHPYNKIPLLYCTDSPIETYGFGSGLAGVTSAKSVNRATRIQSAMAEKIVNNAYLMSVSTSLYSKYGQNIIDQNPGAITWFDNTSRGMTPATAGAEKPIMPTSEPQADYIAIETAKQNTMRQVELAYQYTLPPGEERGNESATGVIDRKMRAIMIMKSKGNPFMNRIIYPLFNSIAKSLLDKDVEVIIERLDLLEQRMLDKIEVQEELQMRAALAQAGEALGQDTLNILTKKLDSIYS